ncbi:hypothetical protein B2H91_10520 [Clostridium botulinum]|uniref:hypothetical protein n=1 Tax=Clostridium botulinum TaxID=1491 RepID=UPI000A16CF12|nr:hypothetical protein [Clostridium botulinum]AUN19039.1 hypothetical protein B2M06_16055 [Clostridium botulinum]OSA86417.1 hypothetical protein B2H91_10520 [Clostridium botulinum]
MEKSFAFNSINGDRRYKAEDFASYFASFIGNGVFPNPSTSLQVIANNDMSVTDKPGKGWINGFYYQNTDDFILKLDVADGVLNRIDKVVLRLDFNKRSINLYIKKGVFASSPVAPTLQRDADAYELGLADVKVNAGVIKITQADITDLRLDKNLCGIVHGVVDQVDITTIFNQYSTRFKIKSEEFEKEFEAWLKTLKDVLGEDTAGNLLNLITKNTESIKEINTQLDDITTDTKRLTNAKDITGAINELFTNANNGKKLISDVVGNPLLATDTFQQQNDKIQSLKNALVSNLNVKGQVISNAESLKSLIDKVLNINTGRKSASGKQDQKNLINGIILEVSDLDFKPSIIFLYVSSHLSYNIAYSNSSVGFKYCYSSGISSNYNYAEFPLFIKSDGFRYENFDTNFWDIRWLAIE